MKSANVSIKLPVEHAQIIRGLSSQPGEGLNNILDEYKEPAQIAAAVTRHILNPVISKDEVKQTSFYLNPSRVQNLRHRLNETYLPFEGMIRILVQDYIQQHQL